MKTLGLMGGSSWFSTSIYYAAINRLVNERLGGAHSAKKRSEKHQMKTP
jgi:aspartate racemase